MHISQSGRSMVEILGVLAVIGVLSIGALMGFRYAMDKYKANEIVNEVQLRAVDVVRAAQQGPLPTTTPFEYYEDCEHAFDEWPTEISGGFEMNICPVQDEEGTDLAAAIVVKDVPRGVCLRLTEMDPHEYMENFRYLTVNGARYRGDTALCQDDNTIVFVMFLEGEDAREGCAPDDTNCVDCTFDAECERNLCDCAYCDRETGTCVLEDNERGEPQVCNEGRCETTQECLSGFGFRTQNGVCVPCKKDDGTPNDGDYNLDPSDTIFRIERDGVVLIEDQDTPSVLCRACGGDWAVRQISADNVHCSTRCSFGMGYVPFSYDASTIAQYDYVFKDGKFTGNEQYTDQCITAMNPWNYRIVREDEEPACEALPNHYVFESPVYQGHTFCGHECVNGSTFLGFIENHPQQCRGGACLSCGHAAGAVIIDDDRHRQQCLDCGMMVMKIANDVTVCAPACGAGTTFIKLPGYDGHLFKGGSCQSCATTEEVVVLYGGDGTDKAISPDGTLDQTVFEYVKQSCEACGNRKLIQQGSNWVCINNDVGCAPDEFLGKDSNCYKCSETAPVGIATDEGSGCTSVCNGDSVDLDGDGVAETVKTKRRVLKQTGLSVYFCAPDICKDGEFQAGDGTCHKCDEEYDVIIGKDNTQNYAYTLEPLFSECSSRCRDTNGKEIRYADYYARCKKKPVCADDEFLAGAKGKCVKCSDASTYSMYGILQTEAKADCLACPTNVSSTNKGRTYRPHMNPARENRAWNVSRCTLINPGVSGSCNSLGDYEGKNSYPAGDGQYFRREPDGVCVPCNTTEEVSLARDDGSQNYTVQCGSCGEGVRVLNGTTCSLNLACSEGASFWNKELGRCMLCSKATGNLYETTYEKQGLCTGCGLRAMTVEEMVNEEVTTKYYCTQKCSAGQWQDAEGNCIACDNDSASGNYIGADSDSKALCTACKRTITEDHNGDLICDKS